MAATIESTFTQVRPSHATAKSIAINFIAVKPIRTAGFALGAVALGFPALVLLLPGEQLFMSVIAAVGYLLLAGMLIGYLNPTKWLLSGLLSWGGILLAWLCLIGNPVSLPLAAILIAGSVGPALLGGYLGYRMWDGFTIGRIVRCFHHPAN